MSLFNTTSIKFTSRASVKIKDSYYTFEACIEKSCPPELASQLSDNDIEDVKKQLWDECNNEVDKQIEDIMQCLQTNRR